MKVTDEQFRRWAAPPSETERQKMENAERAVRNALSKSESLSRLPISVFAQGSYRNRVNVRGDSDVDIAVVYTGAFFYSMPSGMSLASLGYATASYQYSDFKNDIERALKDHFGWDSVTRGRKAFDVHANTYRVDADVAPFFVHRRFDSTGSYISGVEMIDDDGKHIINWPEQHYENGVRKNTETSRSFKGLVRILKTLRYAMIDAGYESARLCSSFAMECLAWNVPNHIIGLPTWAQTVREAILFLFEKTSSQEECMEWGEVSELKYFIKSMPNGDAALLNRFVVDMWGYLELK